MLEIKHIGRISCYLLILDGVALAKRGDHKFSIVCMSLCLFVIIWLNHLTYYQSKEVVCSSTHLCAHPPIWVKFIGDRKSYMTPLLLMRKTM